MPVFDIYASRLQRAENAGLPDVYVYDQLPPFLRMQLSQVFTACIGPGYQVGHYAATSPPNANKQWNFFAKLLDKELSDFESWGETNTHPTIGVCHT